METAYRLIILIIGISVFLLIFAFFIDILRKKQEKQNQLFEEIKDELQKQTKLLEKIATNEDKQQD